MVASPPISAVAAGRRRQLVVTGTPPGPRSIGVLLVASAVVVMYTVLAVDARRRVYGRRLRSNPLAAAFQMPVESSQDTDMKLTAVDRCLTTERAPAARPMAICDPRRAASRSPR